MSSRSRSTPADTRLADYEAVFNALSHGSRRQILLVLRMRGGSMTSKEIAGRFSCAWPTTTRHLRQLERAGLVAVEQRGRERVYHLNAARLYDTALDWLHWFSPESASGEGAPATQRKGEGSHGRIRHRRLPSSKGKGRTTPR